MTKMMNDIRYPIVHNKQFSNDAYKSQISCSLVNVHEVNVVNVHVVNIHVV